MKIEPLKNQIYLKMDKVSVGALDTSSYKSAIEFAEVLAVGKGVENIKKGDKVFVKGWAIDIITYKDITYHFVNIETGGVLAKVNE